MMIVTGAFFVSIPYLTLCYLFFFFFFSVPTTGPTFPTNVPTVGPTPPTPMPTQQLIQCNLCVNDGEFLTNDDAVLFTDPNFGIDVTCEQAQFLGFTTGYTANDCQLLQFLAVGTCGCPNDPTTPTQSPAGPPVTIAPTMAPPPPVFCQVCFDGTPVSGAGTIGGVQCQQLAQAGAAMMFNTLECLTIQIAAEVAPNDPCNCSP
jgi:hypothetical protein